MYCIHLYTEKEYDSIIVQSSSIYVHFSTYYMYVCMYICIYKCIYLRNRLARPKGHRTVCCRVKDTIRSRRYHCCLLMRFPMVAHRQRHHQDVDFILLLFNHHYHTNKDLPPLIYIYIYVIFYNDFTIVQ